MVLFHRHQFDIWIVKILLKIDVLSKYFDQKVEIIIENITWTTSNFFSKMIVGKFFDKIFDWSFYVDNF